MSKSIYHVFSSVVESMDCYHRHRKIILKREHPKLLLEVQNFLPHIDVNVCTVEEILYNLRNDIIKTPLCVCGGTLKWNAKWKRYGDFCSRSCSGKHTFSEYAEKHGVENISQLDNIKKQKVNTFTEKYGVTNPSYITEVKETISKKQKHIWAGRYEHKDFTVEGLSKEQYRHRIQQLTNTVYENNKQILDPEGKRSSEWHIDHIYSVMDGFINDVPIDVMCSLRNLRLIPSKENYKKHSGSMITLEELYETYKKSTT